MHEPTIIRVEFNDHGAKTGMTFSDGDQQRGPDAVLIRRPLIGPLTVRLGVSGTAPSVELLE
jgi:hypothetical protein